MSKPSHICCSLQTNDESLSTIRSFKNIESAELSDIPFILININLNWNDVNLSSDYGITIGQELRTKFKYKNPIIFYSPLPHTYFEEKAKTDIKYKLLFGRGSSFVQIPTDIKSIENIVDKIKPLSNAALIDVTTMLCDLKGMILDKLNHNLKISNKPIEVINEVIPYLSKEQLLKIRANEYGIKLSQLIKEENQSDFFKIKEEFINLCSLWLGAKEAGKEIITENKPDILLIDDESEVLDKIEQNLKSDFNIHRTTSGAEAVSILQKDTDNSIKAIIADWRLYKDSSNTEWQGYQGYEILEIAAKTGFRPLIALTSQPEYIVNQIRNSLGIHFSLFKKDDVIYNDSWSMIISLLKETIEQQNRLIASIPQKTHWYKDYRDDSKGNVVFFESLHLQYLRHLNSSNKEPYFKKIDAKCNEVWDYVIEFEEDFESIENLRQRFGLSLPKNPDLYATLVLRRIWIALWYYEYDEKLVLSKQELIDIKKTIFEIISPDVKSSNSNVNAQVSQLCIEISQLRSYDILPEEKKWLLSKEKISLDNLR